MVIQSHCCFGQSTNSPCCLSIDTFDLSNSLSFFSPLVVPVIYTYWPGIHKPFSCNIMCDVVRDGWRLTVSV